MPPGLFASLVFSPVRVSMFLQSHVNIVYFASVVHGLYAHWRAGIGDWRSGPNQLVIYQEFTVVCLPGGLIRIK